MSRSIYKGPYVEHSLIRKLKKIKQQSSNSKELAIVRTYSRKSTILPSFVGMYFEVYNGRRFIKFYVNENMIGYKLGEFSPTRTFIKHSGDKGVSRSGKNTRTGKK